ncbi:MAG: alpha-1,2-fucosyltransferase [Lachnospiraceae bacterium]|nr:alpha-1,2-fucosyltransferase [Lachnospiraceae bacterium]
MIIIRIAGGLGNQMQQYAMYRRLLNLKREVKLDLSWFSPKSQAKVLARRSPEFSWFVDLPYEVCTEKERDRFLNRSSFTKALNRLAPSTSKIWNESEQYHPELFALTDAYLQGNFLNNKYFEKMWPELRTLFRFPMHTIERYHLRNVNMMNEMLERQSISVHIRRGDYLDKENAAIFGGITTDAYYEHAMAYMKAKNPKAHFYIFTNDTPYALEHYADEDTYTIIDWNTDKNAMLDIQLMSCCKGNICANSTFSFWGARLNARTDKEVIRPYRMRNNQTYDPDTMHDYWKGWILMDEHGKVI